MTVDVKKLNTRLRRDWEVTTLAVIVLLFLTLLVLWICGVGDYQPETAPIKPVPVRPSLLNPATAFRFHQPHDPYPPPRPSIFALTLKTPQVAETPSGGGAVRITPPAGGGTTVPTVPVAVAPPPKPPRSCTLEYLGSMRGVKGELKALVRNSSDNQTAFVSSGSAVGELKVAAVTETGMAVVDGKGSTIQLQLKRPVKVLLE